MHDNDDLESRVVAIVERRLEACRAELHAEMVAVAHKLRADDAFMKPASETFVDHAGSHLFDKAARRLLMLVIGIFGAAALGLAVWLGGKGFK